MATLTVGILLYGSQTTTNRSESVGTVKQQEAFARETALVGLDRTLRNLVDRPDGWAQTTTFAIPSTSYAGYGTQATYQVDIQNYRPGETPILPGLPIIDDTLDVRAVGTYQDRDYTIRATYTKGVTDIGVPPALRKSLVSDKTLRLNGSPKLKSSTTTTNADIHANGSLDAQGSPVNFVVEGYGTYSDSYDGSNTAYFQPNQVDPTASGTTYEYDPLYVPTVNVSAAASTAHLITTPPSGTFSVGADVLDDLSDGLGAFALGPSEAGKGTPEEPFIWYVGGDMVMGGSLRLPRTPGSSAPQGHVKLYVDGNLTFQGNGSITPTYSVAPGNNANDATIRDWISSHLPEGSTLAIYVAGNVNFNGNVSVAALIHANGAVTFGGGGNKANIIGSIVSKETLTFNGNNKLWYTEASETVKDPGYDYDVPTGVFLLDYLEWPERPGTTS